MYICYAPQKNIQFVSHTVYVDWHFFSITNKNIHCTTNFVIITDLVTYSSQQDTNMNFKTNLFYMTNNPLCTYVYKTHK